MTLTQRGTALILGLVLLASTSLLAVAAASGAALQRRMAANWEERTIAFSHAAIADSQARSWITSRPPTDRGAGCGNQVIQPSGIHIQGTLPNLPEHQGPTWWESMAVKVNRHPELGSELEAGSDLPGHSYWLAEEVHCQPATAQQPLLVAWYRILSRAGGDLPGSVVVTESIVARPWGPGILAGSYPGTFVMAKFCAQFDPALPCGRKSWRQRR